MIPINRDKERELISRNIERESNNENAIIWIREDGEYMITMKLDTIFKLLKGGKQNDN